MNKYIEKGKLLPGGEMNKYIEKKTFVRSRDE